MSESHGHDHGKQHHHHHILSLKQCLLTGAALLALTVITVVVAGVDLGKFNFLVAMLIATTKASLVALIFMNLLYDKKENLVIFMTSFLFLAIFLSLTATDLFFRGDVYVKKGGLISAVQAKSKLSKPWVSTPELVAHGHELFTIQCVSCHGTSGQGDGPAAAALSPHPRNFTSAEGWKNGRKASDIFKTLKEGLPPSAMPSFATLPVDDRWALIAFVRSITPNPPETTAADFAKVGIDITKEGGGAAQEEKSIPIDFALERMAVDSKK
jgi:cytochrome c oxidase subunit 4